MIGDYATVIQIFKEAPPSAVVPDPHAGVHRPDRGADAGLRRPRVRVRRDRRSTGGRRFPQRATSCSGASRGSARPRSSASSSRPRARAPLQRRAARDPLTGGVPGERLRTADRPLRPRPQVAAARGDAGRRLPGRGSSPRPRTRRTVPSSSRSTRSTRRRTSACRPARTASSSAERARRRLLRREHARAGGLQAVRRSGATSTCATTTRGTSTT